MAKHRPFNPKPSKNMDYEQKYNEALAWMRELYPGLHGATKEDAEHYFPELRESEDEELYREIYSIVHHYYERKANLLVSSRDRNEMLEKWEKAKSFLKKQKEQKDQIERSYSRIKKTLALGLIELLDKNRPEGKMCLSNAECADIDKAFSDMDWEKIMRYVEKYR